MSKENLLNCKVRCIDDAGNHHTLNELYYVINGKLETDTKDPYYSSFQGFTSVEDINLIMTSKFSIYKKEKVSTKKTIKEQLIEWSKEKTIVIETHCGERYLLLSNGLMCSMTSCIHLNTHDDNLHGKIKNINVIYEVKSNNISILLGEMHSNKILWEREKEKIVITRDEIAKKFGYDKDNIILEW